jgi:arylsulfatase
MWVQEWSKHSADERRLFVRLQAAYAAMLEHTDQQIARLTDFLDRAGLAENTIVLVLSDNGASQEGGPQGFVNAMGPYNFRHEPLEEKLARIDDIGGPDTHSNFPLGWAMASNTPLRRYKQNTHGGGIRDPLVMCWPHGIKARGELRHQFTHACDLTPTLLDLIGAAPPPDINGVKQMPFEGVSFARSLADPGAPSKDTPQYFEMFGHRGIVHQGWKAVAFHPPGKDFADDKWELYDLTQDFNEVNDLAAQRPDKLRELIDLWWQEAEAHKVLPLDDRFGERFAENAARHLGERRQFTFHAGVGHIPTDVCPDLRSRSYLIEAHVHLPPSAVEGVLIAHGDATCGYALYAKGGLLIHDVNVGGEHQLLTADMPEAPGDHVLAFRASRKGGKTTGHMLVDGVAQGSGPLEHGFVNFISWSGLDIGCSRGSPVSHYKPPFKFTGALKKVVVTIEPDQALDADGAAAAAMARE